MEAECLHQPDQIEYLAICDFAVAVADQRVANQMQIFQERLVADIAGLLVAEFRAPFRQFEISPDTQPHDFQLAAVRFLQIALRVRPQRHSGLRDVLLKVGHECFGGAAQAYRIGKLIAQGFKAEQIFAVSGLRLHPPSQSGDFRRHQRVAIAIASDP